MSWEASGIVINVTRSTPRVIASYAPLAWESALKVDVQIGLPLVYQPPLGRPGVRAEALRAHLPGRVGYIPDLEPDDFGFHGTLEGPPDHQGPILCLIGTRELGTHSDHRRAR